MFHSYVTLETSMMFLYGWSLLTSYLSQRMCAGAIRAEHSNNSAVKDNNPVRLDKATSKDEIMLARGDLQTAESNADVVRFYHGAGKHFDAVNFCRGLPDADALLQQRRPSPSCSGSYDDGDGVNELGQGFYVFPNACDAMEYAWSEIQGDCFVIVLEMTVADFQRLRGADTDACVTCDRFYDTPGCRKHLCMDFSFKARESSFDTQMVFRPTPEFRRALRVVGSLKFKYSSMRQNFLHTCRAQRKQDDALSLQMRSGVPIPPEQYTFGSEFQTAISTRELLRDDVQFRAANSSSRPVVNAECEEKLSRYGNVCDGIASEGATVGGSDFDDGRSSSKIDSRPATESVPVQGSVEGSTESDADRVRFYHGAGKHFDAVNFCRGLPDADALLQQRRPSPSCSGSYDDGDGVNELGQGFYVFPNACDAMEYAWSEIQGDCFVIVLEMTVADFQRLRGADTDACVTCDRFYDTPGCRKHLCMDFSFKARESSFDTQMVFRPTPDVRRALRVVGSLKFKYSSMRQNFLDACRAQRKQDDALSLQMRSGVPIPPEQYTFGSQISEAMQTRSSLLNESAFFRPADPAKDKQHAATFACESQLLRYKNACDSFHDP
eukprot:TRINITY_DN2695_c0_g1_i2.p1 TRINITY_DN2695_c0_g1~~TRINITY_DN2695_c0_g1_i2.p1  ORF type:complete len:608 (+),score=76.65 TRINITY_DN2695_c0_g1_i2:15-1838(+)